MGHYMILIIFGLLCGLAALDIIANFEDVRIYYYKQSNINSPVVIFPLNQRETVASHFDKTKPSLFIIHGWTNDYGSGVNVQIKAAVLNLYDVNIFVVDWSIIAANIYPVAVANVATVGNIVGQFINELVTNYTYPYSSIRLVGHSLGAHVCGYAGRTTNSKVASIVGLDPAGPLYVPAGEGIGLVKTDARYVQIIHTCADLLGNPFPEGVSDFWPNSGFTQPGCIHPGYSHNRSFELYAESISRKGFLSKKCSSYLAFALNFCYFGESAIMGGYIPDASKTGNFYLDTNDASPYSRY